MNDSFMDHLYETFRKNYIEIETLFNSIQEGVIIVNTAKEMIFWNTAARRITGTKDSLDGRIEKWSEKFKLYNEKGEYLKFDELPLIKAIKGEEFYDYRVILKNAVYPEGRIISVNGNPIRNGYATVGGITTFRDITDEVDLNKKINTERKLIRNILDFLPRIVVIKDLKGNYLYANKKLYELYNTNSVIGKKAEDFIRSGETTFVSKNTEKVLKSANAETFIERFTRKDGHKINIESIRFPYTDDKGEIQGICVIAEDITRHIDREAESEKDREELTDLSIKSAVGILAQDIVQEIETPIEHLSENCNMLHKLAKEAGVDNKDISSVISDAEICIQRIGETARRLSRMARNLSQEKTEEFIFQDVVQDVLHTLFSRIEKMKLKIKTNLPEEAITIRGNKLQITDVLLNLLISSLDALEEANEPELQITVRRHEKVLSFQIVHNGRMMNGKQIESMFAITSTTELDYEDKIGMSLLPRMIDQQKGEISYLKEEAGHGFILNLPLQ